MESRTVCFVAHRLGAVDGVSVAAAAWMAAFAALGFQIRTVAGEGIADRLIPGLAIEAAEPPSSRELKDALGGAGIVVVENVCSLPCNPAAAAALARCLRGRRAILHHHDLPWQRERFAKVEGWPPDDPSWLHVTINELSRAELAERGIRASTVYNGFFPPVPGDRERARRRLRVAPDQYLLLQPTRAIPRKNVPGGISLAEATGAVYWLTGPAEEGYGPELARLLRAAACELRRGTPEQRGLTMADAYAAADAILLPSRWEGFGNPAIEAAFHRKQVVIGDYPAARELARLGFRWLPADDPEPLRAWLARPDPQLLERNHAVAVRHFSIEALTARLARLLERAGWLPSGAGRRPRRLGAALAGNLEPGGLAAAGTAVGTPVQG